MPRQTKVADHPVSLPDLTFSQTHRNSYKTKKGRTAKFFQITRQRARFTIRLFLPLQCLTSVFGMGTGMTTAL